jgi:peptide/nickel transport system substrate-binding protein
MRKSAYLVLLCLSAMFSTTTVAQSFNYPEEVRPTSLLPFFTDDMSSVRMSELIFDSLLFQNKRGEFKGGLATSWRVDSDKRGIKFVLREGVTWHDGREFSAQDVVFTVMAAQDPKTVFAEKGSYRFIREVRAEGKYGVHMMFSKPIPEPERRFVFKILPKHSFRSTAISRRDGFNRKPIGTGPFRVSQFGARKIVLSANRQYWNPAKIKGVSMEHTPDKRSQVALLQYAGGSAGVHAVIFLPPKNLPTFENSDSVVLEPYHTVSWWYLAFNHENRALSDPIVRQALALALDREELVEAHLGRGDVLSGPFTESSPFYNFEVEPRSQNVEEANRLLDKAGYGRKGQYRSKGRTKLNFKFVLDKELAETQSLFVSIQAQLKKIGVKVSPKYYEFTAFKEQVFKKKKFDLTMHAWTFDEVETVSDLFHSSGVWNFINYKNERLDAMLDDAERTEDYKLYKKKMRAIHAELNGELPYFFLWSLDIYSGVSKRVRNLFISPYTYFTSFPEWELKR